jgi:hypothetical protein
MRGFLTALLGLTGVLGFACAQQAPEAETDGPPPGPSLEVVAELPDRQVTGVTVDGAGRVFVSFPRWGGVHDVSVARLADDGRLVPYPDMAWNSWTPESDDAAETPGERFVCVQSVVFDGADTVWALDPASPGFQGVVPGGAKLVAIDVATDTVRRVYSFPAEIAPEGSYLNDVRIDLEHKAAYITDSHASALVVVDLDTGEARRVLDDHPATQADEDVVPLIGGREWRNADGVVPQVHADGIALDVNADRVWWHALTGLRLWSIDAAALRDPSLDDEALAGRLTDHGDTVVSDGMLLDASGRVLHTALERDAIVAWSADAGLETVVRDPLLAWPDTLAAGPDGWLYVTTSQIHLGDAFGGGRSEPYRVLRWRE